MQIVGRSCDACGKRMGVAKQGRGCLSCDLAWHRTCLEDAKKCPRCGASFRGQEAHARRVATREDTALVERGRVVVGAAAVVIVALQLFPFVIAKRSDLTMESLESLVICLGLLVGVWTGRDWARQALVVVLGISALLLPLAGSARPPVVAGFYWLLGAVYVAALLTLAMSKSAKAFLMHQRRNREGDPSDRNR